ncbi:MAG: dipicolinate synthase subunit B [Oscillospiraceae bacterium]|nr:dipicolinate synthase subunit B [Oscillospiraceae bacterium]MBQ9938521.1 dipicolinate synthase subunit B [Oscillospiraceae bacterium]
MEKKIRLGIAMTGSFCTFAKVLEVIEQLAEEYDIFPIMSEFAAATDTRFGKAEEHLARLERISGKKVITHIAAAEPIGPKKLLDALVIIPCTGNTLGKLAGGITDTAVTMAAKANLRNGKPLIIAVSSNDSLSASAKNIGQLMNCKNVFFVPLRQDDPVKKPTSVVCNFSKTAETVAAALQGQQLQPMLL